MNPDISKLDFAVVIPTLNRPNDLSTTVHSVLAQTVIPVQLIIVDQSHDDESRRRIHSILDVASKSGQPFPELLYIHDPAISGASAARNRAFPFIRSAITLFLDDDVILDPTFITAMRDAYIHHPGVMGVSGIITNYTPPSLAVRLWRRVFACGPFHDDRQPVYWRAARLRAPVRVTRFGAGLMSFWTAAIRSVRFDDNLSGACDGEDVDFCAHLGPRAHLLITPQARLIHQKSPVARVREYWLFREACTAWYLYRRNWDFGLRNRVCFLWLNVGYLLVAILIAARRRSMEPLACLQQVGRESRALLGGSVDCHTRRSGSGIV